MFIQLKRQQNQKLQQQMGNSAETSSMQSGSSMSSFQRMNTLGSFANMGSLSKMSSSDMSVVLSSQEPVNGRNNQSWGNPNLSSMNERMHSSLPIMNSSYGRLDSGNRTQQSMSSMGMGMNPGRNVKFNAGFGNHRPNTQGREMIPNEFMNPMVSDDVGSSFLDARNPFNNSGGNQNSLQAQNVHPGGFGGSMNDSRNGGSDFNSNSSPMMDPKDLSKLSNEQLRHMIMMDAIGNNPGGSRMVSTESSGSLQVTNKSNSESSASSNPFLKNLGIMNYRNHVLPLSIEKHSSKLRKSDHSNMTSATSDLTSSIHSNMTDFNQSNSNFSFHSDIMGQDDHGTMPDENESYNAAANGILAPWSARAAGLFGDMMIQSTEDEKAKKASRKKPKDKPKRPLSAYNIFFKEERNRILNGDGAENDAQDDGVPSTISVGDARDSSTKSEVSDGPTPNESRSSEDTKSKKDSGKDKSKKKIGFESLAKLIGRRWQELDDASMSVYKSKASVDMERYKREMEVWDAKHGNTSSRKRKASNSTNKKPRRGEISSSSAHEVSGSSLTSSPSQKGLVRRNSTGGSLDLSTTSQSTSSKQTESDAHGPFRDLSKARLGTDLFRLNEVEEDTNNGMI